ncbi:Precorrin-2 C(20)-methyltransferase [Halomonadaceae bacterium LMG 33818]
MTVSSMHIGTLYGVGVGPGDPELLTLKAFRILQHVDVVAYFAKAGNRSCALTIAQAHIPDTTRTLAMEYPVTTELPRHSEEYKAQLNTFHDNASKVLADLMESGLSVAVISEGDPLFYGSFMHLHIRLAARFKTEIIPGITGMSGSWSLAQVPICQGDDVFKVVPGTLEEDQLVEQFQQNEAIVVMKIGRHLGNVRQALKRAGRLQQAIYVERATQERQQLAFLKDKPTNQAPYFSLVLIPGFETAEYDALKGHVAGAPINESSNTSWQQDV